MKKISGNSLTLLLPEVVMQVLGNRRLTKKFKKEKLRNEMTLWGSLAKLQHIPGNPEGHVHVWPVGKHKKDPRRP